MHIRLIYPRWPKLQHQTEWHLPPHGPVVLAACVPSEHELRFTDENLSPVDFGEDIDVVFISIMLTCQAPRGWEIGDTFRARGIPVVFGGIATMLHTEETKEHADAVFLGEAEGRLEEVLEDAQNGQLKKVYDHLAAPVQIETVKTARRSILQRELYNYRGLQMVDLVHASRGCRFSCYPCCVQFLGGRAFRPRPIAKVVAEVESIHNNRLFFVDNSLAQDKTWELELFRALAPLRRSFISHPIEDDDEVLAAAADAGAWFIYQAIFDTSDYIRNRVQRYKKFGIAVEGTILLGLDEHDEDSIKRLVDFLLEIDLDLAEFTILTPFPHTPAFDHFERSGRVLSRDWRRYTGDQAVIQPARMSPGKLEELYHYAWNTFYAQEPQALKMGRILRRATRREERWGTRNRFATPGPEAERFRR